MVELLKRLQTQKISTEKKLKLESEKLEQLISEIDILKTQLKEIQFRKNPKLYFSSTKKGYVIGKSRFRGKFLNVYIGLVNDFVVDGIIDIEKCSKIGKKKMMELIEKRFPMVSQSYS